MLANFYDMGARIESKAAMEKKKKQRTMYRHTRKKERKKERDNK